MARIRTIKPELRESIAFASLTDRAARVFLMLYTLVDDAGRCPATPGYIAGAIYFARPTSPNVVGQALRELEVAKLIKRYRVGVADYLEIEGWLRKGSVSYQRIEKPQPEIYPAPDSVHSGNDSGNDSGNHSGTDLGSRSGSDLGSRSRTGEEGHPPDSTEASEALVEAYERSFAQSARGGGGVYRWGAGEKEKLRELERDHGRAAVEKAIWNQHNAPPKFPAGRDVTTLHKFWNAYQATHQATEPRRVIPFLNRVDPLTQDHDNDTDEPF